jgi:hypothetical protein
METGGEQKQTMHLKSPQKLFNVHRSKNTQNFQLKFDKLHSAHVWLTVKKKLQKFETENDSEHFATRSEFMQHQFATVFCVSLPSASVFR